MPTVPVVPPKFRGGVSRDWPATRIQDSGRDTCRRLMAWCGLDRGSTLLDLGCGGARVATGIIMELGSVRHYQGLDARLDVVSWAQVAFQEHPWAGFRHLDVRHPTYNRDGALTCQDVDLGELRYDVVLAFSLFSHLAGADAQAYLALIRRALPGRALVTAFVEPGVPDQTENPTGYLSRTWNGPLHCVRYGERFWHHMLGRAGLAGERMAVDPSGQTYYRLTAP